jgi:hypothetical protein
MRLSRMSSPLLGAVIVRTRTGLQQKRPDRFKDTIVRVPYHFCDYICVIMGLYARVCHRVQQDMQTRNSSWMHDMMPLQYQV